MAELKPPRYLKAATRRWWASVIADYELEPHHVMQLTAAAQAWDRFQGARGVLDKSGLTYDDDGKPRSRPEIAIERDSRLAFMRAMRELSYGCPDSTRPSQCPGHSPR